MEILEPSRTPVHSTLAVAAEFQFFCAATFCERFQPVGSLGREPRRYTTQGRSRVFHHVCGRPERLCQLGARCDDLCVLNIRPA